jgi:hypothetical protein
MPGGTNFGAFGEGTQGPAPGGSSLSELARIERELGK